MAISYPLAIPTTPGFVDISFKPFTVVGESEADVTKQAQIYVWQGMGWALEASLPAMPVASADAWVAWKLGLNGKQGTFQVYDQSRPTTRGSASGSKTCGVGNVADSTTLITAGGTGSFALSDWLQIGNYLYKVVQVNSATSYDVWPRLRAAHANGTAITYTNAKGLFRLTSNMGMEWNVNAAKHYGLQLSAKEAL